MNKYEEALEKIKMQGWKPRKSTIEDVIKEQEELTQKIRYYPHLWYGEIWQNLSLKFLLWQELFNQAHAKEWILTAKNMGRHLSIDESMYCSTGWQEPCAPFCREANRKLSLRSAWRYHIIYFFLSLFQYTGIKSLSPMSVIQLLSFASPLTLRP